MRGNLNDLLKELPPDVARHVARYGVRLAIDLLETLYTDLDGAREPEAPPGRRRAQPHRSGWSDNPEERSQEMQRRFAVRKEKAARAKRSAAARKRWENMSSAQRQAWQRAMRRGRGQHGKTEEAA